MAAQRSIKERNHYPVSLDLLDRRVLMVGGGKSALEECRRLIECGADLTVLASSPAAEMRLLAKTHSHRVELIARQTDQLVADLTSGRQQLEQFFVVFAFSQVARENGALVAAARRAGVLICENTGGGDFSVVKWVRRGHVKITVTSDGISPSLEEALLSKIEADNVNVMDGYSLFLDFVSDRLDHLPLPLGSKDKLRYGCQIRELAKSDAITGALKRQSFQEASQLFEDGLRQLQSASPDEDGEP